MEVSGIWHVHVQDNRNDDDWLVAVGDEHRTETINFLHVIRILADDW